jgi:hypothetical protein
VPAGTKRAIHQPIRFAPEITRRVSKTRVAAANNSAMFISAASAAHLQKVGQLGMQIIATIQNPVNSTKTDILRKKHAQMSDALRAATKGMKVGMPGYAEVRGYWGQLKALGSAIDARAERRKQAHVAAVQAPEVDELSAFFGGLAM